MSDIKNKVYLDFKGYTDILKNYEDKGAQIIESNLKNLARQQQKSIKSC